MNPFDPDYDYLSDPSYDYISMQLDFIHHLPDYKRDKTLTTTADEFQRMINTSLGWGKILFDIHTNRYTDSQINLSGFELYDTQIKELALALQNNNYITSLNLNNNHIETLGELALNPKITTLKVSNNRLGPTEAIHLAQNKVLTHLEIADNQIGSVGTDALLTMNTTLKSLNIVNNETGSTSPLLLPKNTTLTHLKISESQLGHLKLTELVKLVNKDTQIIIDLIDNPRKISYENWQKILIDIQTNQYTDNHLDLSNYNLHDLDIKLLNHALESNDYITSLNLENNNIHTLGELAFNNQITSLNVSHNHLGPTEAIDLALNKNLTHLEIAENTIGPTGAYALLVLNTTLTNLNILNNNIGAESLSYLQKNTTLTHLKISGSELGNIKLIEFLHPDSKIVGFDDGTKKVSYDIWKNILIAIETNLYTDSHLELSSLNLNNLDIEQLTHALENNKYITSLNLENNNIGTLGELVHSTKLTSLNVSNNYLKASEITLLAQNKSLNYLEIAHNHLGENSLSKLAIAALGANTNLIGLNLSHNGINAEDLLTLVESTQVKHLSIGGNFIDPLVLTTLGTNTLLQSLDVSSNLYSNGNYDASILYQRSPPTPWLYSFSYNGDVTIYSPLTNIKTLESLDMSYNQGIPLNPILIAELNNMPALSKLNLSHTFEIGRNSFDQFYDSNGKFYANSQDTYKTLASQIFSENIKLVVSNVDVIEQPSIIEWVKSHPEIGMPNLKSDVSDVSKTSILESEIFSENNELSSLLETSHKEKPTLTEIEAVSSDNLLSEINEPAIMPYSQTENALAFLENTLNKGYDMDF